MLPPVVVVVYKVVYVVVFPNAHSAFILRQHNVCVRVCNECNASLFFSLRHTINNKRSEFLFVSFDTLNMTVLFYLKKKEKKEPFF